MNPATVSKLARSWALVAVLIAGTVVVTWDAWSDIVYQALHDPEQSHVLMALPVAVWLGWLRRRRLRVRMWQPSYIGPGLVTAGFLLSAAGYRTGWDVLWHAGAVAAAVGALLTVLGVAFLRQALPSFLALVFLMPVPGRVRGAISLPLQKASATGAEWILELFAVPVVRSGSVLVINDNHVAVAEACNGMRMVSALALVVFLFVFSVPMRHSVRLVLLALSPVIALLANILRLVPTVLMYGYSSQGAADVFHDISGWAILVLSLGVLWMLLSLLRWLEFPIVPHAVGRV